MSPAPRRAPIAVTCRPSQIWKTEATAKIGTGGGDDGGVGSEGAGKQVGNQEVQDRREEHKGSTQRESGPSGSAGPKEIAAADRLADPDTGRGGETQRNHKGERDAVERHLVAGERHRTEARDEEGDHGKDRDLDQNSGPRGNAQREQAAEKQPLPAQRDAKQAVAMAAVEDPDGCGKKQRLVDPRAGGRKNRSRRHRSRWCASRDRRSRTYGDRSGASCLKH